MVYALPSYIYIEANSPEEAQAHKHRVEQLLGNPMIKSIMLSQAGITLKGFVVQDPVLGPQR